MGWHRSLRIQNCTLLCNVCFSPKPPRVLLKPICPTAGHVAVNQDAQKVLENTSSGFTASVSAWAQGKWHGPPRNSLGILKMLKHGTFIYSRIFLQKGFGNRKDVPFGCNQMSHCSDEQKRNHNSLAVGFHSTGVDTNCLVSWANRFNQKLNI